MSEFITPIRSTVMISQIRDVWHRLMVQFGNSKSIVTRLMSLYLGDGVSFMLNPDGLFTASCFNQLAKKLKFRYPREMTDAVKKSEVFICGLGNNSYGMVWFASPLYLDEKKLAETMEEYQADDAPKGDVSTYENYGTLWSNQLQNATAKLQLMNSIINNTGLFNIILSGRKSQGSSRSVGATEGKEGNQEGRKSGNQEGRKSGNEEATTYSQPYEVRRNKVQDFLRLLFQDKEFFEPLRHLLTDREVDGKPRKEGEFFTPDEAHQILREIIYKQVQPYFISNDRFFQKTTSFEGRKAWLSNWIYGAKGRQTINKAIASCRRRWTREKQETYQRERREQERTRMPGLSEFEWKDSEGRRFYEDSENGVTAIAPDAPPRTSATAYWNKFTSEWN